MREDFLQKSFPIWWKPIREMMDTIITNVVLVGQIPAPTFHEKERVGPLSWSGLPTFQVDECTTDGFNNAIGVIQGTNRSRPPIFLVAHMDTPFGHEVDHHFTIKKEPSPVPACWTTPWGWGFCSHFRKLCAAWTCGLNRMWCWPV
jgi:hypothetical protein